MGLRRFQYSTRWPALTGMDQVERAAALDERDRQIEDSLESMRRLVESRPKGYVVATSTTTATNSGVSGVPVDVGPTATFTAEAGRRYRWMLSVSRVAGGAADVLLIATLTDGANSPLANVFVQFIAANTNTSLASSGVLTPAAGSQTIKLRAGTLTATAVSFQNGGYESRLLVEDIGAT